MRTFVIALALGLGNVAVVKAQCTIVDFTLIDGVEGGASPCSSTTLADDGSCLYKATDGYTVSGGLSNVCGTGTLTTTAAPVVTGCAADYYQSTAGVAVASNGVTVGVCSACPTGSKLAAADFVATQTFCSCPVNFYQSVVGTKANSVCVTCGAGDLMAASTTENVYSVVTARWKSGGDSATTMTMEVGDLANVKVGMTVATANSMVTTQQVASISGDVVTLSAATTGTASGTYDFNFKNTAATAADPDGLVGKSTIKFTQPGGVTQGTALLGITAGMLIAGANVPAGTTVVSVTGLIVSLSKKLTASAAGVYTFAPVAAVCSPCPAGTMGTAGTCKKGCPANTYQSGPAASGTAANIECTACDLTTFNGDKAAQAVGAAVQTANLNCGTKGCGTNYQQASGADNTAASCVETAQTVATCVAIDAIDEARCAAITPHASTATACTNIKKVKPTGVADTVAACTYTAAVTRAILAGTAAPSTTAVADPDCSTKTADSATCVAGAGCAFTAQLAAADAVCGKCAAGKILAAATKVTGAAGTSATSCNTCNPYTTGHCTNGCPAGFWQSQAGQAGFVAGGAAATFGIKCTACESGKTVTNTGVLTSVQTAAACVAPGAAAAAAASSAAGATVSVVTAVAAAMAAAAVLV